MKIIITEEQKKKLFIPRKLSGEGSRWSDWNKEQPIKDGVRINQYDLEGKPIGYWDNWIDDDMIIGKGSFVKGKKNGYWEEYWSNNQLLGSGNYNNGKETGIWDFYDDGIITHRKLYVKGKMIGKWNLKNNVHESIKASEACGNFNSFKTLEDGKRGIAWVDLNDLNETLKSYVIDSIDKNDFGYITVIKNPYKPIIIYRNGYREKAEELAEIASKYDGYLSGKATYEDSKRIGELLEYNPEDIQSYLNKNYVNGTLKEGIVYNYALDKGFSDPTNRRIIYRFKNKDDYQFEVIFYNLGNNKWEREYNTNKKGLGTINTNDVYNIMETVTNITLDFIEKYKPNQITITHISKNKEINTNNSSSNRLGILNSLLSKPKPNQRALLNKRFLKPAIDKLDDYYYHLKGSTSIIEKI